MGCLIFLFSFSLLFAGEPLVSVDQVTGYVIESYDFVVKGKTKDFALRREVVPPAGDPTFSSEEAMKQALVDKKQKLINKRIFTSVDFTYALSSYSKGIASYAVTFFIEDASTFLAIPYPKFDNDQIGLRLGVKIYDKNLFGTFSDLYMVGHISQGNGGLTGWENREDYLEMTITDLPIGKTLLDFSFDYSQTKNSTNGGDVDFSINWTGIKLFGTNFSIEPWGKFDPSSDFTTWNPDEYGVIWTLGPFFQNEGQYSLYNKLKLYDESKNLYTLTYINQLGLSIFTHPISFNISTETDTILGSETLNYLNLGATVGTGFQLPFGLYWSTSFGSFVHYKPNNLVLPYSHLFSNTISKSKINWEGNFRKGSSFSLKYATETYPQVEYESSSYWYIESEFSYFPIATKHFNPSIQFIGYRTNSEGGDHRYFIPSDSDEDIDDYFRGYLSSTISDMNLETGSPYGAIFNINLSMTFIDFGFANTYANPFLDIGFFEDPANPGELLVLSSAGAEGYVIFDKFPSYPIRGSLGFNLSDVKKALNDEISISDVEFELTIGMGLFF